MISALELNDFQAHKSSRLEFDPGVNVITGVSDSGKSACLRALYWVLTNRPSGLGFIRKASCVGKKSGKAQVTITVVDAGKSIDIVRTRTSTENACTCGDQAYNTLGKDVPEDVLKTLNMTEINIQRQLDGPFLILDSPGAVAAKFNQYTNLDKVDQMVAELSSKVREFTQTKSYVEGDIDTATFQIERYSWLKEFGDLVAAHEEVLTESLSARAVIADVAKLHSVLLSTQARASENAVDLARTKNIQKKLNDVLQKATDVEQKRAEAAAINAVINTVNALALRLKACEDPLPGQRLPVLRVLLDVIEERELKVETIRQLRNAQATLASCDVQLTNCEAVRTASKSTLEHWKSKLLEFDTCPACGQALTESARAHLVENTK